MTLGLGPALFDERFGLAAARPTALRELPRSRVTRSTRRGAEATSACRRARATGGAARAALERVTDGAEARWSQEGSLPRAPGDRPGGTPRDVLGFKGGTANLRRGRDLDRHVWVGGRERSWMLGGSFLVVRRIRVALRGLAGAARRRAGARDRPPSRHRRAAGRRSRVRAAARGAARGRPRGARDARAPTAARRCCAAATPSTRASSSWPTSGTRGASSSRSSAGWPSRTRSTAYTTHVGSAVFAVPPGARPGGFLGEGLFAALRPASSA